MKTKNSIEILESKVIPIIYNQAEKISNSNICEKNGEKEINKLLVAVDKLLYALDLRDGELNNDIFLTQARNQVTAALNKVGYIYAKNLEQQNILSNVIPLFPEHIGRGRIA
jgi:hypothetical protein